MSSRTPLKHAVLSFCAACLNASSVLAEPIGVEFEDDPGERIFTLRGEIDDLTAQQLGGGGTTVRLRSENHHFAVKEDIIPEWVKSVRQVDHGRSADLVVTLSAPGAVSTDRFNEKIIFAFGPPPEAAPAPVTAAPPTALKLSFSGAFAKAPKLEITVPSPEYFSTGTPLSRILRITAYMTDLSSHLWNVAASPGRGGTRSAAVRERIEDKVVRLRERLRNAEAKEVRNGGSRTVPEPVERAR